ncbi:MAG: twin-arginine translocation signal domain-containing protein, partial [Gammaproteobacteria bacterium]|nr:twin-arginine translocation signal domain-containing protein [Gammaproteobacteria bacterium]
MRQPYFGILLEKRLSRRGFIAASGAAVATAGALPTPGATATSTARGAAKAYQAISPSREDALRLS